MTRTYTVEGMTCGNCKTSVENNLKTIEGVKDARVNLEDEEAMVEMEDAISIQDLQNALPPKYTIRKKEKDYVFKKSSTFVDDSHNEPSKFQQLKPLILILSYIVVAANLIHYNNWNITDVILDFMGLFFIVFSFFKMLDLKGFSESFRMYDPLAKTLPMYGWVYPFIETILGLMFLFRFKITIAVIAMLIVLGLTTYGVAKTLLNKKSIQCACLGTVLKLPMTEATIIENSIMLVMGFIMLFNIF